MPHSATALPAFAGPRPNPASPLSLWRYLAHPAPITLGEGWTPLTPVPGNPTLLLKDEGRNPHGSFADRIASILATAAAPAGLRYTGHDDALAASIATYAAAAGRTAQIRLSARASELDYLRSVASEAELLSASSPEPDALVAATRLAHQTLAFEIAEQLQWDLPAVLLLPPGFAEALPVYGEAFALLRAQGWIGAETAPPRCVAVSTSPSDSQTVLNVDEEQVRRAAEAAARSGRLLSPEGAAALAAASQLPSGTGRVVLIQPRSAECSARQLAALLRIRRYPQRIPVGGIISPQ